MCSYSDCVCVLATTREKKKRKEEKEGEWDGDGREERSVSARLWRACFTTNRPKKSTLSFRRIHDLLSCFHEPTRSASMAHHPAGSSGLIPRRSNTLGSFNGLDVELVPNLADIESSFTIYYVEHCCRPLLWLSEESFRPRVATPRSDDSSFFLYSNRVFGHATMFSLLDQRPKSKPEITMWRSTNRFRHRKAKLVLRSPLGMLR